MNIFGDPCNKIRGHVPTAPGTGALATERRTLPSVVTCICTAAPSWRPPGDSTVSLGAISVNSMKIIGNSMLWAICQRETGPGQN